MEIELKCNECDKPIEGDCSSGIGYIEPCEDWLTKAEEKGYEQGDDEGYYRGHEEGSKED